MAPYNGAWDVEIAGLHFAYPDGHIALRDVHLRVAAGEKVALVGPNGAGKSTLLLHLNGILQGNGLVRVAGVTLNSKTLRQARARVGFVFQDPDDQLFSPTVFDDVAYGPLYMGLSAAEAQQRTVAALAQVGMEAHAARPPHHLSVGEKKRVALATALAMHPQILALDEPSAGLDPRARRRLIALLQSLSQTLLVSAHDMRLVQALCSRTVVLDGGQVVADGPTAALLADDALLEAHGLEKP